MTQRVKPTTNTLPEIETIGDRIQTVRKNRNLTQQQLADKIGVKRYIISNFEMGRTKLVDDMLKALSIALNISTDELLGLKPLKGINMNTGKKRIRH